jgi:predicted CXXCH cytochrome family protein
VYFTHKRHIAAGVQCEHCHGQLAAMPVVRQVKSMKMGFCVSCHEANHAPTDCVICHM